jgi:hypothetical protein
MPSINNSQEGILFINGDDTNTGDVTNSAISFTGGPLPVSANFTCLVSYQNPNPFFDLFIQKDTNEFTLKYELRNPDGLENAKLRTIEFQKAKILNYMEVFDRNHQTLDGLNDLLVVISIGAISVTMGEANFPSGS